MKFRNKAVFIGALILAGNASLARAGSEGPATLEDCYQAALKQSESFASQAQLVIQAEQRFNQALGSLLPAINGTALAYWQNLNLGATSPIEQNMVKVGASLPLFQGFREYAALKQVAAQVGAQKQAQQWAAWQLYADTARAFNLVLLAEKTLADYKDQSDLYGKRVDFLRGWLNIGRAQDTDLLSVQTAQAQVAAAMEQAKYQLVQSRDLLAFLTGLPADTPLDDSQKLPDALDPQDGYLKTLQGRPDILAAQENLKAAQAAASAAFANHLPSASANVDYYAYRFAPLTDLNWDATISVTLPIFAWGAIHAQAKAADAVAAQAELALRQVKRMDEENLRDAYARTAYDLSQESALEEALALAEKNYKATARNFELGLVTNLDVLQSMVTFVTTQQALDAVHYGAFTDFAGLQAQAGHVPNFPDNDTK